jgi:hypothetical protein
MTCEAKYSPANAALKIETWSGSRNTQGDAVLVCSIENQTVANHMVKITNYRTHDRKIYVEGSITSNVSNAKFVGKPCIVLNPKKWEESLTVSSALGDNITYFEKARIEKVSNGRESIKLEVEYEDSWNPGNKIKANNTAGQISFSVDLI